MLDLPDLGRSGHIMSAMHPEMFGPRIANNRRAAVFA
jgi:hypothetical protein